MHVSLCMRDAVVFGSVFLPYRCWMEGFGLQVLYAYIAVSYQAPSEDALQTAVETYRKDFRVWGKWGG